MNVAIYFLPYFSIQTSQKKIFTNFAGKKNILSALLNINNFSSDLPIGKSKFS